MPRAENRKRPANMLGNVPGSGLRQKGDVAANRAAQAAAQDHKQALLEKMKRVQESKRKDHPDS